MSNGEVSGRRAMRLGDDLAAERLFAMLANELRLRIIEAVGTDERSLDDLMRLTDASPSSVLTQVSKLRAGHILVSRRSGTEVIYRLDDPMALLLARQVRAMAARGQLKPRPHVRGLWTRARSRATPAE